MFVSTPSLRRVAGEGEGRTSSSAAADGRLGLDGQGGGVTALRLVTCGPVDVELGAGFQHNDVIGNVWSCPDAGLRALLVIGQKSCRSSPSSRFRDNRHGISRTPTGPSGAEGAPPDHKTTHSTLSGLVAAAEHRVARRVSRRACHGDPQLAHRRQGACAIKVRGRVRFATSDVLTWLRRQRQAEPGRGRSGG